MRCLLLFDALSEITTELHRLKSNQSLDLNKVEHDMSVFVVARISLL